MQSNITKLNTSQMLGIWMRQSWCHALAPSIRAASIISVGMDVRPVENSTMWYPLNRQADTAASTKLTIAGSLSHLQIQPESPSPVRIWLNAPFTGEKK